MVGAGMCGGDPVCGAASGMGAETASPLPALPGVGAGAGAGSTAAGADLDDIRTMPARYDGNGMRYSEYRSAVEIMDTVVSPDFLVAGLRTVWWCCKFMLEHGGTPRGWHARRKADRSLQAHDQDVSVHEMCWITLERGICCDQVNAANLSCMELVVRQLQVVEEKWKDRYLGGGEQSELDQSVHLYLGLGAGVGARAALCICPLLSDHIAGEFRKEAAISKERRKAREERQLAKPKVTPAKKGGDG